ncbi:hypothetical protein [Plantactinospora endophytica]|uniref:Toxin-antitoxin system HicB family antitoxin n=1 Tax=Plantactinospora endophytica TaxID=673535 RepID=A0ABQ4DX89_9ACTN|nr:hypothetical protein [Plantactinospora endophytica]GIG86686.1 hypothetical protein Pen02_16220 [Plantactinospora endophytica]
MDLAPYLAALRRDLATAAAPGGPEISRAAELLAGSLDVSARLCLLEVLADATAEITSKLDGPTVEVRLRAREADLVVHQAPPEQPAEPAPAPPSPPTEPSGDVARITLRLPEGLKDSVERAAGAEGVSVNAWLVRAVAAAVPGATPPPPGRTGRGPRRISGWAQS